jgi:ABC-type phosphate transport system permease subunit
MNYAEIEAINRQTAEMTRKMMLKWEIVDIVLAVFCVIMIALAVRLIWEGIRERKERKAQEVFCGNEFQPVVTDCVQYDQFGTEYRLMGVAGRR